MRHLPSPFALVVCALSGLWACGPSINQDPPTSGPRAVFDPASGIIPLPNDILRTPASTDAQGNVTPARLNVPISPSDSPLTVEIKQSLNRLDGWPPASTLTLPFDQKLDPATLTGETVQLYDLGTPQSPKVERRAPDTYFVMFNVARQPASAPPYLVTVMNKASRPGSPPAEFEPNHSYALVLTSQVTGENGEPVIGDPVLELLKSTTPLADSSGQSLVFLPSDQAVLLEQARSATFAPAFDALGAVGISRDQVISYTVFTTQSSGRVQYNPTSVGRIVPIPIDLGQPANAPVEVVPSFQVDLPYDPATVTGSVFLYEQAGTSLQPVSFEPVTSTTATGGFYTIELQPAAALKPDTTYVAIVTDALRTSSGVPMAQSSYFTLVRATHPLIDPSTDPPTANSPYVDLAPDVLVILGKNPATASQQDWDLAYTLLGGTLKGLEELRVKYAPLFTAAEQAGHDRAAIIALWAFTTQAATE